MRRDVDPRVRIRFEHTRYPHWGGHSGYVQLVRFLEAAGFRCALHGASDSDADWPRWLAPLKPPLTRIIRRGGMPWYKLSDLNAELGAFADCLLGRWDVVHFLDGEHSGRFLPRLLRLARRSSVRVMATFHQPPAIVRELLDPALLRQLDEIVLVSPSQRPYFAEHVVEERLHVILHGVDTEFFHPTSDARPAGRMRCITAGYWLRDWPTFRAVAAAMTDVDFAVVAGRRPDVEGLPNVRTYTGIDDERLAALYRSADVLFLPLLDATANNALLEGMASGLPVVASDLEAVRAYLPREDGILVRPGGPGGFLDALARLRGDAELRVHMGRRARRRAEALAWPRLVRQYEALYRFPRTRIQGGR